MNSDGIFYAIRDALHNLKTNKLMSLASIVVLVACLVLTGTSVLLILNINEFVSTLENQNEIVLFIDENADEEAISVLQGEILNMENVDTVTFVSKDEALEEYKAEYSEQAAAIESLDENPLRDSFHIKIKDLKLYDEDAQQLKKLENVANVREKKDTVQKILNVRRVLTVLAIWIMLILFFVSVFIISNTVRIAMFTRKLEINIMKFVGATDGFIRLPFLFEGITIGLIAGGISVLIQWYVYGNVIVGLLTDLSLFQCITFESIWRKLVACFLASGVVIGILGSLMPMKKYLKV